MLLTLLVDVVRAKLAVRRVRRELGAARRCSCATPCPLREAGRA